VRAQAGVTPTVKGNVITFVTINEPQFFASFAILADATIADDVSTTLPTTNYSDDYVRVSLVPTS